jgi:hypothetical protein
MLYPCLRVNIGQSGPSSTVPYILESPVVYAQSDADGLAGRDVEDTGKLVHSHPAHQPLSTNLPSIERLLTFHRLKKNTPVTPQREYTIVRGPF